MNLRTRSVGQFFRFQLILLAAVAAGAPSTGVLAQTYGAQQAVRRSLDNLGRPPRDTDQGRITTNRAAVSYARDVLPILQANCHGCHSPGDAGGGLEMTVFDSLLGGGESGMPAIVPGDPDSSYLIQQITPRRGQARMPKDERPLADAEIALIRRWIEQGAVNDSAPMAARDAYSNGRSASYDSAAGMIDTTYVSPTAIAVAAIRPAQLLSSPTAELLPTEVITAAGLQYLGFEPSTIDEVIVFVGQINMMGPTEYGAVIKFTGPFRAASINRGIRAHARLSEFAGKRYLQSQHPMMPSFFGPDNRTLIVAPDATLRRLVDAKEQAKTGPLLDRVRNVPAGSDLYLAVDTSSTSLRPFIEMGVAQAKAGRNVPFEAQKFLDLPKLISALELTLNISPSGPMSLVLHANDDAAAEQLETALLEATNRYQGTAPSERYYGAGNDPVAQAMAQFTERFSRPFRPQRNGASVTLFQVEAQSQAQQQLASLAVFGVGVGIQALQAAQAAAERTAATAATAETTEGGGFVEPAPSADSSVPPSSPRR
jgi:mono/diheme cytochrome c family protein